MNSNTDKRPDEQAAPSAADAEAKDDLLQAGSEGAVELSEEELEKVSGGARSCASGKHFPSATIT